jgi:hypothetical protein
MGANPIPTVSSPLKVFWTAESARLGNIKEKIPFLLTGPKVVTGVIHEELDGSLTGVIRGGVSFGPIGSLPGETGPRVPFILQSNLGGGVSCGVGQQTFEHIHGVHPFGPDINSCIGHYDPPPPPWHHGTGNKLFYQ